MRSSQTLSTLACTLWLSFAATASAQDATQPTDSTETPPASEEATPTSLGSPFPPRSQDRPTAPSSPRARASR